MSTTLLAGTISSELKAKPDEIYDGQALPNADTSTSDAFRLGKTAGRCVLVVKANGAISIADTKAFSMNIPYDTLEAGSYANSVPLLPAVTSGIQAYADGDVIAERDITNLGPWAKLQMVTTADESSEDVDAYIRYQ